MEQDRKRYMEGEIKRWKGFASVWTTPEPEVGTTPRHAVWKKNKAVLWHYPSPHKRYNTPLFLIYSLVNQPFILDLAPGSSMIEAFVNSGFDVYLLDFGIPGYEDKDITIDDYILRYIQKSVQRALQHARSHDITIIGYCLGGTLAAMYAAVADEPIRNLILVVTPVDFGTSPFLESWRKALQDDKVSLDDIIQAYGIIPADFMEAAMRLAVSPLYFSRYLSLIERADDPHYVEKWRRFNNWSKGHIPFAGAALRQLIHDLGKENKLAKGDVFIEGKHANLAHIHASLLAVSAANDRLVSLEQSKPIMNLVSSTDKTFHLVTGGHVTFTVKDGLPDYVANWLPQRSNPVK